MWFIVIIVCSIIFGFGAHAASKWHSCSKFIATSGEYLSSEMLIESTTERNVNRATFLICVTACIIILGWYNFSYTSIDNSVSRQKETCTNTLMAYSMSQNFVKQQLKAPSTAVFPTKPSLYRSIITDDCTFKVTSHVESPNSLGSMIATSYTAELRYSPASKKWSLISLKF